MPPTNPLSQYEGIIGIEEPVIKVVETALRTRSLPPWLMALLARSGAADFGFAVSWSELLEPYAQRGIPDDPAGQLEWEVTRDLFYRTFAPEFASFCMSFDNAPTKFLHLHAMLVQRDDPLYWMVSPDLLVSGLLKAGQFGFYTGPPGAGKSDYAFETVDNMRKLWENHVEHRKHPEMGPSRLTRITGSLSRRTSMDPAADARYEDPDAALGLPQLRKRDMAHAKDFRVLTNTQFGQGHPTSPYLRFCPAASDYHIESDQAALDEAFNVQVFDEYGANSDRGVQNKKKRSLEMYARRVRKNWGAMVYVSQDEGDLTSWITDWLGTRIEMSEDHSMVVSIDRTPYTFKRILGVWRTTIPYNTASRSPVIPDVIEEDYTAAMGEIERAVGFTDPIENEREIHHASIRWVKQNRHREAASELEEAEKERPRRGRNRAEA